jgi:hypothetical protein
MAVQTSELRQIKGKINQWDARLRVTQSLIWLPRGIVGGLVVAVELALVARLWPIIPRSSVALASAVLAALGGVVALVVVWIRRRNPLVMARRFDRLFDLRERLSTALELSQGILSVESRTITRRQLEQAAKSASRVNAARQLPLRLDWRWWVGALFGVLIVAIAVAIPNPQDQVLAQKAEVKTAVTQSLTKLEQLKSQVLNDTGLTAQEQQAAIQSLDKAIDTLKQPDVSQQEALAALNSSQQELSDLSQQSAAQRQQALEAASGLFSGTAAKDLAQALKNGDMQGAADALKNLDLNNLTPEEQQQLAQALSSAAGALKDSNPNLAQQLGQAGDALKNGDTASAQKALGAAGDQMSQQADGSNPQIQQYSDQVGQSGQGVARAGKNQTEQPGQGGMGQTPQNGMGQAGPGQGQNGPMGQASNGGSGRGAGDGKPDGGGTTDNPMQTDNGAGDGGERSWDDVFAPQRIGGQGGDKVDIPGTPGAGVPTGVEGNFANNPSGQSNVPYNQVWSDYASAVNQALASGYIPLGMRDLIKNYFSNLDPGRK